MISYVLFPEAGLNCPSLKIEADQYLLAPSQGIPGCLQELKITSKIWKTGKPLMAKVFLVTILRIFLYKNFHVYCRVSILKVLFLALLFLSILCACFTVCLPTCLSLHLSVSLSVCSYLPLYIFVYLSLFNGQFVLVL